MRREVSQSTEPTSAPLSLRGRGVGGEGDPHSSSLLSLRGRGVGGEGEVPDTQPRALWLWLVLAAWAGVVVVICGRVLLSPRANSVYPIFAEAGRRWLAGEGLYPEPGGPLGLD